MTGRPPITVRYPIDPLAALMGLSVGAALAKLGVSGTTAKEYRARGVSERVADRLATRAGFHVGAVWPEIVDAAIADVEIVCARPDCGTRFVPVRRDQTGCSPKCAIWVRNQRRVERYRTDPDWAAARKASAARYHAENREYVLRAQARYRERRRAETVSM